MTTENIEKKVAETVVENKEMIGNIIKKGTDHNVRVILLSALLTGAGCFGLSVLSNRLKNRKTEQVEEGNDVDDILKETAEAIKEVKEVKEDK